MNNLYIDKQKSAPINNDDMKKTVYNKLNLKNCQIRYYNSEQIYANSLSKYDTDKQNSKKL